MPQPCPFLPKPRAGLDWRRLNAFGPEDRGGAFYEACLEYGHDLWLRRLPARAILCLDRAMGADLDGSEPQLARWPLPYAAMAWFLGNLPDGAFTGNPRVHFQHYADRMNEPRRELRRWRSWACWALTRRILPQLPGDPRHRVEEPSLDAVEGALATHGLPGEAALWRGVLEASGAS